MPSNASSHAFVGKAPAIAGQRAVAADDAMGTGDDNRDRIGPVNLLPTARAAVACPIARAISV